MSIRSLLLSFAAEAKCSLDEAAEALHAAVDSEATKYKSDCEAFQTACDAVISENPTVTKEALIPMVAMSLTKGNPASFAKVLGDVGEYVNLTYIGKRGRRAADDTSVRLTKRA